jgi:hypothetical protein
MAEGARTRPLKSILAGADGECKAPIDEVVSGPEKG